MSNEPLEREPIDRVRARLEALRKANAAPRCGARSKRTGKPCRGAAMPNGRCKLHGGKSTGCRLELDDKIPDHSTFSVNRHGWFRDSDILRQVFEAVVRACMDAGLVKGEG